MIKKLLNDEISLLSRIAQGDQRAFKILYDSYHRKIYSFCYRQLKSVEQAEEVLQETFMKIWLMEDELLKVSNFEAYLRTIARNRCYDYIRKNERDARIYGDKDIDTVESVHNDTEEAILLADTKAVLQRGVELLPPQQKLVYELCHAQGLKFEEAAGQLNLSPLTVKNHMQAAMRFLRQYVSNHTDLAVALIILKII